MQKSMEISLKPAVILGFVVKRFTHGIVLNWKRLRLGIFVET